MSDYTFHEKKAVPVEKVFAYEKALYMALGMSEVDATAVATALVDADASGVFSHGIQRNTLYIDRFEKGGNNPTAQPEIVKQFGATALVNGNNAMGMVVCEFAMNLAIDIARKYGTSAVSVTGSNHFGTCARYLRMASEAGMIGFLYTINCVNIMAPWGGTERQLGNNPYGISAPCGTHPDVVMDMATSVAARGKIVVAKKTHSTIPDTWALDVDGNPTTDPEAAYLGTVQPFSQYKGYCQTFMNATISAILNGSNFGPNMIDLYETPEKIQNSGHLFQCINIDAIDDLEAFKKRMDAAVDYIKAGKKAKGVSEIFVPGERSARNRERAKKEGIIYPIEVIEENIAIAEKYKIPEELRL